MNTLRELRIREDYLLVLNGCYKKSILFDHFVERSYDNEMISTQIDHLLYPELYRKYKSGWVKISVEELYASMLGIMNIDDIWECCEYLYVYEFISIHESDGEKFWYKPNLVKMHTELITHGYQSYKCVEINNKEKKRIVERKHFDGNGWYMEPPHIFKFGQKTSGIYKITNVFNQKVYIGKSKRIETRYKAHLSSLIRGKHSNPLLQRDFLEQGGDMFTFEIIKECEEEYLDRWEKYYHEEYNSLDETQGYNRIKPIDKKQA